MRADLGRAHAAQLAAEEAAKYEPYLDPRHLAKHDHATPVSHRRPEPFPTFFSPSWGLPGHRLLSRDSQPVSASSAARASSMSGVSDFCQAGRSTDVSTGEPALDVQHFIGGLAIHHNSTASLRMSSSIFDFSPPYEIRSISRPRTFSIRCLKLMNSNDDVPGGASTRRSMSES